ncbi:MAG: signal peptidase II [Lachnospiraceae bacterium]|nr:signal peptidase II [Lachnospiraceae bacterium]
MGSILSLLIAGGAFTADRAAKRIADKKLSDGRTVKLAGGILTLQKAENSGFAKNRLSDHRRIVVAVSTAVFAVFVVIYAITLSKPALHVLKAGLGLMLGGAAGNVFDRLIKGKVTDFLILKPINGIIFNLADVFILTGTVVTVLCDLLTND